MERNEFIERYMYLADKMADKYELDEDGRAELYLHLCEKAESAMVAKHQYQCLVKTLEYRAQKLCKCVKYADVEEVVDCGYTIEDDVAERDLLYSMLPCLTPREEKVVSMFLAGDSYEEIAAHFELSYGRILQIYNKALRKMRRMVEAGCRYKTGKACGGSKFLYEWPVTAKRVGGWSLEVEKGYDVWHVRATCGNVSGYVDTKDKTLSHGGTDTWFYTKESAEAFVEDMVSGKVTLGILPLTHNENGESCTVFDNMRFFITEACKGCYCVRVQGEDWSGYLGSDGDIVRITGSETYLDALGAYIGLERLLMEYKDERSVHAAEFPARWIGNSLVSTVKRGKSNGYLVRVELGNRIGYLHDVDTTVVPIGQATVYPNSFVPEAVIGMLADGRLKLNFVNN